MIVRSSWFVATVILAFPGLSFAQAPPPAVSALKTEAFEGKSIGRTLKYNVILPKNYDVSTDRYPVLYLLHGYSGNFLNWARNNAPKFAKDLELIVVMPDGGNSWYANWAESEDGQKNDWEDYIVKDLIGHVDSTYRTIASRAGRAINGLSMGGYGALMLGLKHPEMFCSIGSHSGALGFARSAGERLRSSDDAAKKKAPRKLADQPDLAIGVEDFDSQVERSPKGKLFATAENADAYDPFKLVLAIPKEKMPHIYIDCGTEDGLLKSSQDFAKILMDNKIPFTYAESAGGHNGRYWSREIGHSMAVQYHILIRNQDKPTPETKTNPPG